MLICVSIFINLLIILEYFSTSNNMSLKTLLHSNCINNIYPFSEIKRYPLNREQIPWSFVFPEYNPPDYNSKVLLNKLWADPPIGIYLYNFITIFQINILIIVSR